MKNPFSVGGGHTLRACRVLIVGGLCLPGALLAQNWNQQSPSTSPPARDGAAMVYDPVHHRTFLFGGENTLGVAQNDIWAYDGTNWTNVTPTLPTDLNPSSRLYASMAFDATNGNVVLFGGCTDNTCATPLQDTWIWSGTIWTETFPATKPSARYGAAMAYSASPFNTGVFLVGGADYTGTPMNDMWLWTGTDWSGLELGLLPPARLNASMSYDPVNQQLVLFGGLGNSALLNDTWVFTEGGWSQTTPSNPPPARSTQGQVYDPVRQVTVMFGGGGFNDTWLWASGQWTQETTTNSPSGRYYVNLAYDLQHAQPVLFGGEITSSSSSDVNDTWTLGYIYTQSWMGVQAAKDPSAPSARLGAAGVAYGNDLLMFGGYNGTSTLADTWTFTGDEWGVASSGGPPARAYSSMAYDGLHSLVVLFGGGGTGGFHGSGFLNDTWTFSNSVWTQANPSTSPGAREGAAMVYDGANRNVMMFGGYGAGPGNDTWIWTGTNWTAEETGTTPQGRDGAAIVFDQTRNQVVMFGGLANGSGTPLSDTWLWNGNNWIQLSPANSPPARGYASMAFDSIHGTVLLFGGLGTSGDLNDTWQWDGVNWTQLTPPGMPLPTDSAAAAFVPPIGFVIFGGSLNGAPGGSTLTFASPYVPNDQNVYFPNVIDLGVAYNSQFYDSTISPSGGVGPYTFKDDGIPGTLSSAGLTLNTATGEISGVSTLAAGQTLSFGIQITDAQGQTDHLAFELKTDSVISFTPAPPPDATASATYSYSLATAGVTSGGTPPYTYAISGAPSWLSLNSSTGLLSATNCTASTAGQYSLSVTDSVGGSASVSGIPIDCNPAPKITNASLPTATYGVNYSVALTTNAVYDTPGAAPYQWSLQSGNFLPAGLNLGNNGVISGTPTSVGSSTFTITFTDAWGAFYTTKFTIAVTLDITNTQLATGNVGIAYPAGQTLIAMGGMGPYTFQAANLPPGLVISAGGTISGTPTTTGNYTPTFTVTDSESSQGSVTIPLFVVQPGTNPEDWYQLSPAFSPQIRSDPSVFYDSVRNKLILFGGSGSTPALSDTNAWDGTNWTTVATTGPSARYGAAAAFDPAHSQGVLFGGNDGAGNALNDTWLWNGTSWSQASPTTVPGSRWNASMAWDGKHIVMFGGTIGDGDYGETWIWDGTNWTLLSPASAPGPRSGAGMTLDSVHNQVVLFGGFAGEEGDFGDTWLWDGTQQTWALAATAGPSARDSVTLAFDPIRGNTVLFGGENDGAPLNDTWAWNGTTWSQINTLHNPGQRFCYGMSFDPATSNILLFGGDDPNLSQIYENDTWILEGPFVTGGTMPPGVEGSVYSDTPAVSGGIAPLTYTASGTPAGVSINASTGAYGGTPTVTGTFPITEIAVDNFGVSSSASLSLTVSSPGLTLSPATLPDATQNADYIVPLSASGGVPGYTFSATGLPAGLSVTGTDILGQCTASSANVVLKVTDSASNTAIVGPLTVNCNPYPSITTTSPLPAGFTNTPYSTTIQMSGGTPKITWTLIPGNLPANFSLSQTGVLTGSSTSPVVANFSVQVTDIWGATFTQNLSLTLANVINFTTTQLPLGNVNVPYPGATLAATGGAPAYSFLVNNNLPPGLSLNQITGAITGTPTTAGNYNPQFTVTDQDSNVTIQNFPIDVAAAGTYTQDWIQLSPAFSPGVRIDASIFYDSVRNKLIMFGGDLFDGLGDTEQWDGTNWTTLTPSTSPSARYGAAAAFDPVHQVGVLFGGFNDSNGVLGDTWLWNGTTWTQATPATSPSARLDAMMAWDGTHIVLFGGSINSAADADTWIWDGTNWTQVNAPNAPPPRDLAGIAYDSGHNQVVMFGGSTVVNATNFNDTWIWNGANQTWTQVTPATSPGARAIMSMAYDPTQAKTFLFGGFEPPNNPQHDTWAWDGTNWTQVNTPHAPTGGRYYYAMAFDPATANTVLFGGEAGNLQNDTWVLDGPTAPNTTLPTGTVNTPYSATGAIAGGIAPFTYIAGTLPPGMTFNSSNDSFGGTPTTANSYSIPVTVQDAWGVSIVPQFGITITPAGGGLTILSPTTLTAGTAGQPYSYTLKWSGGVGTDSITSTNLPAWLNLNSSTGVLTGTPPAGGAFTFTVVVTDSQTPTPNTASQQETIIVSPPAITTVSPLTPAYIGIAYSQNLTANSGTSPYNWTAANLPEWLTLSSGGTLSGTPPAGAPSSITFNATVTDSLGAYSTASLTLPVLATPGLYFQTASPLPPATPNVVYLTHIRAAGGDGILTVNASGLPNWLTFNIKTGALTGTPPSAGPVTFQMTVTDDVDQSLTQYFTLPVNGALQFNTTSPLPPASAGLPYSQTLVASGGSGSYTWSAANLPAWLSLSATGVLTGTPPQAATVTMRVTVTDTQNHSISQTFVLPVVSVLTIETTSPLPPATMNFPYTATFTAAGGAGNYQWSSSNLPSGFTLSAAGVLLGTPQAATPLNFSVTVFDSLQNSATLNATLPVNSAITLNSTGLPEGVVQLPYSANLTASGGVPGYTFTATGLPAWLTLTQAGYLAGTPTSAGAVTIQVTVNDSSDGFVTAPVTIIVNPALSITTVSLPGAFAGIGYSTTVAAAGGLQPYLWSSTKLPGGLSLSSAGVLSGTVAQPGTYSVEATVWDSGTSIASQTFTLQVTSQTPLSFVTAATLPTCVPNSLCSNQIVAQGGVPPYTFKVPAGTNLNGLSLSTGGLLSGTPASGGSILVPVTLNDQVSSISMTFIQPVVQSLVIVPNSLTNATVGLNYGIQVQANGGQGLLTWSMAPNSLPLPPGLSLDTGAGAIFGTPTTAGAYTFSLQVTDGQQVSPPQQFTITVVPQPTSLSIASAQILLPGTVGVFFNQSLVASGGSGGYNWTLAQNSVLPGGLNLAASGAITGTPTTAGNTTFTAKVTDSSGNSLSSPFTITIVSSNTVSLITPNPLPNGAVGVLYYYAINVAGGTPPYFYSITGGQLPPGITFDSTNGTFTGTPAQKGAFGLVLNVTDSGGESVGTESTGGARPRAATTSNYVIQIAGPGDFQITTQSLPPATLQRLYNTSFTAANGAAPYTWSLVQGTLPAGLTLTPGGSLTGSPAQVGVSSIVVKATDTTGASVTGAFQLEVVSTAEPTIIPVPPPPSGTVGTAYSFGLSAAGGHTPYTWSAPQGALPPGISLNTQTGVLSGTPAQAGNYQFTAEVTDNLQMVATQGFTLRVDAPTLQITPSQIPIAITNAAYSLALGVSGGTPPYSWSLSAGGLLTGFSINPSTGAITGTPTTPGTYPFTISVVDSNFGIATATFQLTVQSVGLSIMTSSLPAGTVGAAYDSGLLAANSTPPLTWSVTVGNLPPGIQLGTSTGVLSGTPATAGSYGFTVQVMDSTSATATAPLTLVVDPQPLTILTTSLPGGSVANAYSQTVTSSGGTGAITWSVSKGTLPGGLSLSPTSGTISGTPSAAGSFTFTIEAADSTGLAAQQQFTVAIAGPPALPAITLSGLPATSKPGDQPTVTITLASGYALPITVTATLSITPNPGNSTDLSFAGGSRTTEITIPANTTTATLQFQAGTFPGTIEISLALSAAGVDVTPAVPPSATTTIAASAPTINSVTVTIPQTPNTINVVIVGTSTTLDMKTATFTFTAAPGATLQTTTATIDVSSLFQAWYASAASLKTGSQFSLTMPFTISGNISDVASVSVTLANSVGSSNTVSANVP